MLNEVWFAELGEEDSEEAEDREKSWADEMDETDGQKEKGEEGRKAGAKKTQGLNINDVIVASCSDDGTVRLWRPLQVSLFFSSRPTQNGRRCAMEGCGLWLL